MKHGYILQTCISFPRGSYANIMAFLVLSNIGKKYSTKTGVLRQIFPQMHTTHERGTITQSTTYDIWFSKHFGKRWWSKSVLKYLVKLVNPSELITSWEKKKILESQMEFESSRMEEWSGRNRWELFLSNVFTHFFYCNGDWWFHAEGPQKRLQHSRDIYVSPFSCNWQNVCTYQKPGSCEIELTPEAKVSY